MTKLTFSSTSPDGTRQPSPLFASAVGQGLNNAATVLDPLPPSWMSNCPGDDTSVSDMLGMALSISADMEDLWSGDMEDAEMEQ